MLRPGTLDDLISRKVSMPTAKSHAELIRDVAPKIRAQAFFSARVAQAHILDKLREISDGYSRGEFGLGEARNKLKDFLSGEGYDPHQAGLRNLASTARLNLIVRQNSAMAKAAAEYRRMHDPDAMQVFPYVRYHAQNDGRTRSEHSHLDGKIFHKDDPFLRTHTPPWEFNCRCYLEEITAEEAGKHRQDIQEPTPADKVTVESRSGFSFDPAHVFEEFELSGVQSSEVRAEIREEAEIEFGDQVHFTGDNAKAEVKKKPYKTFLENQLVSSREWNVLDFQPVPPVISPEDAIKRLKYGFTIETPEKEEIRFDEMIMADWEKYDIRQINGRLSRLEMAIATVKHPVEIWYQESQSGFIGVFKTSENKPKGCLVFVTGSGTVKTYFPKDLNALDKARKGISVKVLQAKNAVHAEPEKVSPHLAPPQDLNKT